MQSLSGNTIHFFHSQVSNELPCLPYVHTYILHAIIMSLENSKMNGQSILAGPKDKEKALT